MWGAEAASGEGRAVEAAGRQAFVYSSAAQSGGATRSDVFDKVRSNRCAGTERGEQGQRQGGR